MKCDNKCTSRILQTIKCSEKLEKVTIHHENCLALSLNMWIFSMRTLSHMKIVDDFGLISDNLQDTILMIKNLENSSGKVGLTINFEKTKLWQMQS